MVIAGSNLTIIDNSTENTTGIVVLESSRLFATEEYLLLVEDFHDGTSTDIGYVISVAAKFQVDNLGSTEFSMPNTLVNNVGFTQWSFAPVAQKYCMTYHVPTKNMIHRVHFQWLGNPNTIPNVKLRLYANSIT